MIPLHLHIKIKHINYLDKRALVVSISDDSGPTYFSFKENDKESYLKAVKLATKHVKEHLQGKI